MDGGYFINNNNKAAKDPLKIDEKSLYTALETDNHSLIKEELAR